MSTKSIDYLITGVRYSASNSRITHVQIRQVRGENVGSPNIVPRGVVVEAIDSGSSFVTSTIGRDGSWQLGEDVHVVNVNGSPYLRTDQNETDRDNLGELPKI